MVKDKIFKREFGTELFRIAENDLVAARTLNGDEAVRKETAMLMVQQSIEKALKALLCHAGAPIPQTHDLSLLVDRLSATGMTLPSLIANTDFDELTPFATLRRYEDGHFEIDESDMAGTLGLAESILSWVKGEIA